MLKLTKSTKTDSSEKPFKCPECPHRTKWKANVKIHVQNVHLLGSPTGSPSCRPFPCPHPGCSYAAKKKGDLTSHSKIHCDEKSFVCSQPNCNYSTNYKRAFMEHARRHTGEKPFVCQFESCSFASVTRREFLNRSRKHTKERPYKCPQLNCEYATTTNSSLKSHQLTQHPKEGEEDRRPSLPCPICGFSTKAKGNLLRHINSHTLEKLFKCDEPNCNYEAKSKPHLESHKFSKHSDEKPFACSFKSCDYRCKIKSSLTSHLKTHTLERRYKCELCPFRAKTRGSVTNHLKNVHTDVRPFKYKVPQCDDASKTNHDLNRHLVIHKREKKYKCSFPLCEYKAVLPKTVKSHEIEVHSLVKFKCSVCEFTCKRKSNLANHSKTHK